MTTTTEPLISAGKGKVKKASCKCHVWKFWATDAICLKQTGWQTILPSSLTTTTGSCCSEPHDQKLKYRDVAFFPMKPKIWMTSQIFAISLQLPPLHPAQPQHRLRHRLLRRLRWPPGKVRHTWGMEFTPKAQDKLHVLFPFTMSPLHLSKWLLHL